MDGDSRSFFCQNELQSMTALLSLHRRIDSRQPHEPRPFQVEFLPDSAVVHLGATLVSCSTITEQVLPREDRPSEGIHNVNITAISRADISDFVSQLQHTLHRTRALDLESLVIRIGELVWSLKSEIVILNNDGGLIAACHLALVSSLLSTKLPGPRGPRPLILHHLPLAVTYSFMETFYPYCDPTLLESAVLAGSLTIFVNVQNEVCGLYKSGGQPLPAVLVDQLIDAAVDVVNLWHRELMAQMGENAPQPLVNMVREVKKPAGAPKSVVELEKEIVSEMRGGVEEEEEDEELAASLLALFQ
jgi:exosome complex component RRP45